MALATAVWFALRAAPGVTFEDSGLLAAAASCFGVPHPPGYPLWTIVAGTWVHVLEPLGVEPVRATNLLSAGCAGGACGFLALLATRLGASVALGAALGCVPAFSPTFAAQAVVTEVYALACLVQAAFFACAFAPTQRPLRCGLLFGLGLAAHPGTLFLAPLLLRVALRSGRRTAVARTVGGVLIGLLTYLAVPLLAWRGPAVSWGGIDGVERLAAHLLRVQYRGGPTGDRDAALIFLFEQGPGQWPWLAAATAAVLAALVLVRRSPPALGWWLATAATTAAGLHAAVAYPALTETVQARLAGSHLPLVLVLVALTALGFAALESRLASRLGARVGAGVLASGALALAALGPEPDTPLVTDARAARAADTWARAALGEAPADAFLWVNRLGATDVLGFPLLYRQVALGERPDVLLVDRSLLELAWYREQLERREPRLAEAIAQYAEWLRSDTSHDPAARRRATGVVFAFLRADPRPLVATDPPGPAVLNGVSMRPGGVLWWDGEPPGGLIDLGDVLEADPPSPWIDLLRQLRAARDAAR